MKWRPGPNETLILPRRGNPIPAPEGYEIRQGNPFVAYLILPKCQHRDKKTIKRSCCGGDTTYFHCKYYDRTILRQDCIECPYLL